MPAKKSIEFVIDENGCFVCTSHRYRGSGGHCQLKVDGKSTWMHRFIYEQCFGEIPEGLVVRHKCDNPACLNPEHLELGTPAENVRDRVRRGRSACGSRVGNSKLTEEQALEIYNDNKRSQAELAKAFKVSQKTIWDIKHGYRWRAAINGATA